jgi:G3E family GTPase
LARIILVLGAAGSGKTTLIADIVRNFGDTQRIGVVFNDDGNPEAVDLPSDLGKFADITSMTAGCFGCADAGGFLERITALRDAVDVILVEPVGFIDAQEMLDTLARIKVSPIVIAVVDAKHHACNLQIGTAEGHVLAADFVLVTKCSERDPHFDVLAWTSARCPEVLPYAPGDVFNPCVVKKRVRFIPVTGCGHAHHHGEHCHDHSHAHNESHFHVATFHARLGSAVTADDVRSVLSAYPAVIRAKGDVDGTHFDLVQGTWNEGVTNGSVQYVTFYTSPDHKSDGDACLAALRPYYAQGWGGLTGTAAATRGSEVNIETVEYQLALCARMPLTFSAGHPVPNPEWHELLNELRKRPGVPETLQVACVQERVAHYLRCARWYAERPERETDVVALDRLHAIAVGVAWFASEMLHRLTPEMVTEAQTYPIIRWLAIGLSGRRHLNIETSKELVVADEAAVSACWAISVGQRAESLRDAWLHNLRLAEASSDVRVIEAWRSSSVRVFGV